MATVENFKVKVDVEGTDKLNQLGNSADNVRGALGGLQSAILGVSFGAFILKAAQAADALVDLSDATGLTVGSINAFAMALEASGGKAKNAEKTILSFYQAVETAADGGLKQQKAFEKLGVSLQDLGTLSEADLLNKTIDSLSKMREGSERSALAAVLLGKSFRSVAPDKFAEELARARDEAEASAASQQKLADFNQKLEKTMRELQIAAGEVLAPFLDFFTQTQVGSERAKIAVAAFAGAVALTFGASVIGSAKTFITLMKDLNTILKSQVVVQSALSALSGPKGWLALGAAAAAAAGAYALLNNELDKVSANSDAANPPAPTTGGVTATNPGNVKRDVTKAYSEAEKAAMEARKRIEQSYQDWRKYTISSVTNDIMNIEIARDSDLAKERSRIYNTMHLSNALKDEEFAQKRKELEAKAALEIAKIREEQNKKFNEIQNSMFIANAERERAFFIEKEILKLNSINAEQLKAEEEVRKQAAAKLGELAKDNNLTGAQAIEQEKLINEQMQKGLDIVRQQYEFRRNMQQDPKAGVEDRLKQIQDSITPFKVAGQMTDSVFNSMNSALDNFVKTGKLKFSDFARSVILDLISIQLRASATQLLTQTLGMFGFNLPARALGGPVTAGQPYLVGEKGPELFLPNTSGNIVPNNKMGQGSAAGGQVVNNNYNISAIDAKGVAQLFAENRMTLLGNVRQAEKELPTRGR